MELLQVLSFVRTFGHLLRLKPFAADAVEAVLLDPSSEDNQAFLADLHYR